MNQLLILLLLLVTLSTIDTCYCRVDASSSSWSSSGIIRRFTSTSQPNRKQRGVNPILLGFQNALSQSSLPFSMTSTASSPLHVEQQSDNDYETPYTSPHSAAARFASVQPGESTEMTATMVPHWRQMRRVNKRTKKHAYDEAFWLDQEDNCNYFDDGEMSVAERQRLIPCSSKTQPVALQGKFNVQSPHQRRLTPSSATVTADFPSKTQSPTETRGGSASTAIATAASTVAAHRPLFFWENMVSGAVSRTVAQTIMHPANCMKTMLQNTNDVSFRDLCRPHMFRRLTVGAGANFILSIPHGAVNFAVLEFVRGRLSAAMDNVPYLDKRKEALGPALDFMSSCISTISCSIVSTPQMMITDVSTI